MTVELLALFWLFFDIYISVYFIYIIYNNNIYAYYVP